MTIENITDGLWTLCKLIFVIAIVVYGVAHIQDKVGFIWNGLGIW